MGLSQAQLRTELREHLGVDDTELDNTNADLLLNRSWWEVADAVDFREKETSESENTVEGTNTIALSSLTNAESIQRVVIEDYHSLQHIPLEPIDLDDYEREYVDQTYARGQPTRYFRRGSNIILYPTPDRVYEVTIYYLKTLADIAASGFDVPQTWHDPILYGAVWRGFARFGDWNRKQAARATQLEMLSAKTPVKVKEKEDLRYAGVAVMRPRYP